MNPGQYLDEFCTFARSSGQSGAKLSAAVGVGKTTIQRILAGGSSTNITLKNLMKIQSFLEDQRKSQSSAKAA